MDSPFLGMIMLWAGNFAPRGWQLCNGQILSIAQNTALFSLLGTTYGGNGTSTFALPDLRGRVPIHWGNGPGLTPYVTGEAAGTETNTLLISNLPPHTHPLRGTLEAGSTSSPADAFLANTGALDREYSQTSTQPVTMNSNALGTVGGGQPINNMPPFLVMTYVIALQGIFPSRN